MKYVLIALLVSINLTGCATMQNTSGRVLVQGDSGYIDIRFSDHDRRLIQDYYGRDKRKKMPPGLAKRGGNLPPGLAKRDILPPGLQGRGLPDDLESSLARLPTGYVRVKVGTDIVLMNKDTRVVFDIIHDID